jgi:homoserine dehydrogenase
MKKIRIGIAGLGTVGKGVYDILQKDAALITSRTNAIIEVVAVANRSKKDFVDSKIKFYSNVLDLAKDENVDVVVEVMGGIDLPKSLFEAAIKNGKKFVTANKALLAEHGCEIAKLAEENNSHVGFESSTAGANPVIKNFRESFAASEITEFYAILNGTCNFILTKMFNDGSPYEETLKEAQILGYAEADPTLDIKGIDTAHKLMILSTIASATKPDFSKLHIEGVDKISIQDVKLANDLGYKIKLLAVFKKINGQIQRGVYPALVKESEKIAQVDGPFNAVLANTSNASWNLAVGRGAGGLTTGSAVVADIIDIACERSVPLFGVKYSQLSEAKLIDLSHRHGKYFLCLTINKKLAQEGNLAESVFGSENMVESAAFIDAEDEVFCGFLTNAQTEKDIVEIIKNLDANLVKAAKFLRVEETGF